MALCRHCCRRPITRPRGLCWTCYYAAGVKDLYPITSKFALGGNGWSSGVSGNRPPPTPTDAPPGTPAKVEVLEFRAAQRVALWHPNDRRSA